MEAQEKGKVQIVVLQRGWVVVGVVTRNGHEFVIDKASVVRRWGTTQGLGELAEKGPLPNTILDSCPRVRAHELTVIMTIECVEAAWQEYLSNREASPLQK